jgi:hypothetical protein
MHVTRFSVAEGEVQHVASNTEIIAAEGIEILGDVIVDGSSGGDLSFIAESGDIVLAGKISFATSVSDAKLAVRSQEIPLEDAGRNGGSIEFTTNSPNGDIVLSSAQAQISSEDGGHALDEVIGLFDGTEHVAHAGGNGGDVILRPGSGTIRFAFDRDPVLVPNYFRLGNGGDGADLTVDSDGFETDSSTLSLTAGAGGRSGRLIIEATSALSGQLPTLEDPIGLGGGGRGGRGGHAHWDNGPQTRVTASNRRLPLRNIVLNGGRGGDGAHEGGNGGRAFYRGRQMNEEGAPAASVTVRGGDGGDIFPSPHGDAVFPSPVDLPLLDVTAGNGGGFVVLGNDGEDGTEQRPDGGDGGDVTGIGGNGGNFRAGVVALYVVAGDGGNTLFDRTELPGDLAFHEDFRHVVYGVVGGRGGDGYGKGFEPLGLCEGCAGGDGGNLGREKAVGGRGGDVLGCCNGIAGWGGDVWTVSADVGRFGTDPISATPGHAGDGNPPGNGGCVVERIIQPGSAGQAESPGRSGA